MDISALCLVTPVFFLFNPHCQLHPIDCAHQLPPQPASRLSQLHLLLDPLANGTLAERGDKPPPQPTDVSRTLSYRPGWEPLCTPRPFVGPPPSSTFVPRFVPPPITPAATTRRPTKPPPTARRPPPTDTIIITPHHDVIIFIMQA